MPRVSGVILVSYLDTVDFWPGFWWQRGLFLWIFHDLYFVSSDVEINFSLGQKQTVMLMCGLRGQLFPFGRFRSKGLIGSRTRHIQYS